MAADIARVQTDNNVHRSLQKEARSFKSRKALVCTKADVNRSNLHSERLLI